MEDDDLPATQPMGTTILKDVIAFVDVRSGHYNQSKSVAEVMKMMGATISTSFNKSVTHVIFRDGGQGTYRKAKKLGVHLLSVLWIECCRQNETRVSEHLYPAQVSEAYDGPVRLRKLKSMQPVDMEEDLARSAARIKRRENIAFRREIRRKCREQIEDGSEPLLKNDYVPRKMPDVVLTPSEFDNYESSDDSSGECVLPLVQRVLMRYPDSPEINDYVRTHGRFRVRNATPGQLKVQSSSVKENCGSDIATPILSRLERDQSAGCSFTEVDVVRSRPVRRSMRHRKSSLAGQGCSNQQLEASYAAGSIGVDKLARTLNFSNGSVHTPLRKISCNLKDISSTEASFLNSTPEIPRQLKEQADLSVAASAVEVTSSSKCSKNPRVDVGMLNGISKLCIEQSHNNVIKCNSTVSEDHVTCSSGLKKAAEKTNTNMPMGTPNISRGSLKRKCRASHCDLTATAAPHILEEPILDDSVRAELSSAVKPQIQGSRAVVAVKNFDIKEMPAYCAKLQGIGGDAQKLTSDVGNTVLRSRNSLDEFKPVFSRRTRRILSLDECGSPGEMRHRRNSISGKALPNLETKHIVLTSFDISEKETLIPILHMLGGFRLSSRVDRCTTHLVTGANRRTINSLLATTRGCWILSKEWIFKSLEAGTWVDEEPYEQAESFPAAKVFRLEKQKCENEAYACSLFMDMGPISMSSSAHFPVEHLKELLKLAGGNVIKDCRRARINIGSPPSICKVVCISELWVLDCITNHRILPFDDYELSKSNKRRRYQSASDV